jgi:hypothetical protein
LSAQHLDSITRKINEQPDIALQKLIDDICVSALCRKGLRFKKTLHAIEQNREYVGSSEHGDQYA